MSNPMTHRLKQIHAEIAVLRSNEAGKIKLSKEEQSRMEEIVSERDVVLTDTLFHTY